MFRPRTIIGGIALGLAFFAALTYGHSAGASVVKPPSQAPCCTNPDWYVNPDETDLKPVQLSLGMLFDGPSLIHHHLTPVSLADLPTDATFGAHLFHGSMPLIKFESSIPGTPGTYSTINKTGAGKYWSSKIATGVGSQSMPLDTPADLIGKWAGYTADTKVFSFGIGYAHDTGNKAFVSWVALGGHKYGLWCPHSPSPSTSPSASLSPSATPSSSPTPTAAPTTPGATTTGPPPTTGAPTPGTPLPTTDQATPVAGFGTGPHGLAKTGYNTTGVMLTGLALILSGVALVGFLAWRRRVRFTA